MPKSSKSSGADGVLDAVKKHGVRWIDLWFVDLRGRLQHITVPSDTVDGASFTDGIGKLDGSSIRGFRDIHDSDMLMVPDPATFNVLPFYDDGQRTARMIVNIHEGGTHERFTRDSRFVAEKAAKAAADMGYDTTYWGPEVEFFVFDGVRLLPTPDAVANPWRGCGYEILSEEAPWTQNGGKNYPIRFKEGYYPAPPQDTLQEYRNEVCRILMDDFSTGLDAHHHEVATAGQVEIDMRYDELVTMADKVVTYKYVAKMVAAKFGKLATFMPKPVYGDNASGMHVHQSLWTKGRNAMYDPDDAYAELSQTGRYYVGGLLDHARSLCALTNPSSNSYRRLVPGYEAPVFIAWSRRNRSANVRIPVYYKGIAHAKRAEYRTPDPSCNPYLAFAAMALAGLDGIRKKVEPGDPVDENIYHLSARRRKELGIRELPGSLNEALEYLSTDYAFLKGAFTPDLLDKYTEIKAEEHLETALRPSPIEFYRYLDV